MYVIKIHERINQIVKIFHLFGMWQNEDESTVFQQMGRKIIYLIFQMSIALSLIAGGILSDDKNESVHLIAMGIAVLVIVVKLTYILWKKEKILEFILEIGAQSVKGHEEFITINKKVNSIMNFLFGIILMTCLSATTLAMCSLPVFSSERKLPFHIWFPLDWKNNTFAYWVTFTFLSIGMITTTIVMLLNGIIWYLMLNCAIKYQILQNQLRNLGSTKQTIRQRKISEAEKEKLFLQELIALIKNHQNIQKYCFGIFYRN